MKIEQHSLIRSVISHILPGLAGTLVYVIITPGLMQRGYPPILGLLLAAALVILPIEMGILVYQAKRESKPFSLRNVVLYREPLPFWQYIIIPFGLVVWGFLATGITPLLDNIVAKMWFSWLPDWFLIFDMDQLASYSRPVLLLTFVVGLVVNGIVLPMVEELYFRGYLLPRLERYGKWAPLLNVSLFSLYHFWTPWQVFSRILWLLPWVYTAWRKRNIYLIIITHCAANTIGWLLTWGLILRQ